LNNGDGIFEDATEDIGVERGVYTVVGDFNGDGALDLVTTDFVEPSVYYNNGNGNHWLWVELVGVESNRQGIGARVIATSAGLVQTRDVLGGGNGFNQNKDVVHYGLGARRQVERLEIRWPSGQMDVLTDVPADQQIRVVEGRPGYHAVQPTVWEEAPPEILSSGSTVDIAASVRPALFSANAKVTRVWVDLSALGGATAVPLVAGDEGTYRLATHLTVAAEVGVQGLVVQIEQDTELGLYWTTLVRQVTVVPGEDQVLLGDRNEDGWQVESQWLNRLTNHPGFDLAYWYPSGQQRLLMTTRDGNFELYSMDADGSNLVNLTNTTATELALFVSPDEKKIAFQSDRGGQNDVYIMNADGSNPVQLTDDAFGEFWLGWSPDGQRLVFTSDRDENMDVFVMDADGGNPLNLTQHPAFDAQPNWSPDGREIVFSSDRDGQREIYVMDADGGNPTRLTHHPGRDLLPVWSPDGQRIGFSSERDGNFEIYVMELSGRSGLRLIRH
jgi:dipeptidyl aminopeptidase/acylaminoacyl peptidase